MTAPVRIEAKAWGDVRFTTLARLLGLARPEFALILVAKIWSWQTENYRPGEPTYVVDRDTIESVLGGDGPEALVRSKLAVETPEGWRMRGTAGSIEWCHELNEKRARAGRARADGARRGVNGRLLCNEDYRHPAHAGHAGPAPTSTPPAQSSAPTPTPDPTPDQNLVTSLGGDLVGSRANEPTAASPPATAAGPSGVPVPGQRRTRGKRNGALIPIPPNWEPRSQEIAKAMALGLSADVQAERFRDHHVAKGSRMADWDAAFRTWLSKSADFSSARPRSNGNHNGKTPLELQLERVAMLEREEALAKDRRS